MGFIDYAWAVSLQKDNTKVKIIQDETLEQPALKADDTGFTVKLPTVKILNDGKKLEFLGLTFPGDNSGKSKLGRVFRASVMHLTAHTLAPFAKSRIAPNLGDPIVVDFTKSMINDVYINTYIQTMHPDKFLDIIYANALAYLKIKASSRIFSSSTKVMSALLTQLNMGAVKGTLEPAEEKTVKLVQLKLSALKEQFLSLIAGEEINFDELFDKKVAEVTELLEPFGPFLEAPSLKHTENRGRCSIYSNLENEFSQENFEKLFSQSLIALGSTLPAFDNVEELWRPEQEAEALQAFNSDHFQKLREEKILAKMQPYLKITRLKSVSFPQEDYTQYLRARNLVQGAGRRLLDILRSAFNYLDEDPRQEMGQLDLSAVIQSLASNKPATDVFSLDEYLKPSFAWTLLFDVSNSMQVKGEYGRALAIATAEAAKELMLDATSWSFFGFNDKLFILKDSTESYSKRVKARIGGLRFQGLTYIPDAITIGGKMLAKRFEEQRVLIVISDGWPYGYPNMSTSLKECVDDLIRKNVIVIGIGVETDRMNNLFQLHASVYTQKDLINKFGSVYINASAKTLET